MRLLKSVSSSFAIAALMLASLGAHAAPAPGVIEVVTFQLKSGITPEQFKVVDKSVAVTHVSKQPGFKARESAWSDSGEWLVIVHWRSVKDADASMASFEKAPAAAKFMSDIEPSTMKMKRYQE